MTASPAPAGAALRTSHSGWAWSTPRPQGESLHAVAFDGQSGYAAGAFGTLLRSTDGGRHWAGISTGLTEPLRQIQLVAPKTVIVAGTCALRRSDNAGLSFRRLPWTASDQRCLGGIVAVEFPSSKVGLLLLGNGNVLRSVDGGRTWSRRTAVPGTPASSAASGGQPLELRFTSETTGFASTSSGEMFVTPDAGNTWKPVVAEPWSIRSIVFPSTKVGYAVGDAPVALRTNDGGVTWAESPLPEDTQALAQIRCASVDVCVGVTGAGDRLARTIDGGVHWESLTPSSESIRAIALPSTTQVVGVGDGGATIVSTDVGATFSPLSIGLPGSFLGLSAQTAKAVYAFGEGGALARTTNNGESWTEIDAATSDRITDISFLSKDLGFVLDRSGQVLRTDNGGDSYQILDTGTAQVPEAVRALDGKHVLLIGPAGLRRSDDGGKTFKPNAQKPVRNAPLFDADRAGKTVVAYGPKSIVRSSNGGLTFKPIHRPSRKVRINELDVVTPSVWYLIEARGLLFRTDDGGKHWRELPAIGTEIGYAMRFSDPDHGWIAIGEFGSSRGGWVLRTNDGGRTWEPQLLTQDPLVDQGVVATSPSVGFGLTISNQLFVTKTSGSSGAASQLSISSPTRAVKKRGDAVRVAGRLIGAKGGERVLVSFRQQGSTRWLYQNAVVASNGTFTVVARIFSTAAFVAQWAGDASRRGTGTPPLVVTAPKRKR